MIRIHQHHTITNLLSSLTLLYLFCLQFALTNAQIPQERDWNLDPVYTGVTVTIFTVLFVLSYLTFYYCFHRHIPSRRARLAQRALQSDELFHSGLDPSVLKTFPVYEYPELTGLDKGPSECSVCLSPFEPGEMLRLLPMCDHVFHVDCVDHWLTGQSTCPLCRAELDEGSEEFTRVDSARLEELEIGLGRDVNVVRNEVGEVRREIHMEGQFGKLKRWNSTGHVAVVGEVNDQNELLTIKMNKSRSCDAIICSNL